MKQLLKQQNIYTLTWCLYYLQGVLYANGSIISQSLLVIFLLYSFYYFIKVINLPNLSNVIKTLKYLAILFGIYGLIRLGANTADWKNANDSITFFKEYELSILPIFAFYYFSKKKLINSDWFYKFSFVFFVTAIAQFFYQEDLALQRSLKDEVTNNSSYFMVSLLPMVVFLKRKPIIQYTALLVIIYFVIQGMKRGAILATVFASVYFLWESYKKANGIKKIYFIILGMIVVGIGIKYFQYQLDNSDYMQLRLEMTKEGNMSNRENMYPLYIDFYFKNASIIELLFGYGADATLKYMGNYAHQDWIETLMNHGFLGTIMLLTFWAGIINKAIKSRLLKIPNLTLILYLFIIIYLIKSMISMSINGMTLFTTSALGYVLAAFEDPSIRNDLIENQK